MQAMVKQRSDVDGAARQRVRAAGLRITGARVSVLSALEQAGRLLSHHDIEQALEPVRMDRVTLYRVLDSLVESGLAHRVSGADRVWRFGVMAGGGRMVHQKHEEHAHFQCRDCGKIVCLGGTSAARARVRLPQGFQPEVVEMTVRGRCAQCAPAGTATAVIEG